MRLVAADLPAPGGAAALWQEAMAWHGRIDVLVNNAAMMAFEGGIDDPDATWDAVWATTWQVNVKAPADLMREAVRHYRQAGGGIIVTVSSWNAHRGSTNPVTIAYAASKARRHGRHQDDRAGLCQGGHAGLHHRARRGAHAAVGELRRHPGRRAGGDRGLAMGEWVPPGDVATLVAFLATGSCRHLTGATLDVNGATYVR